MTFGERLKAARIKKNLTQRQLALMINAKHNSISNWETGNNKPDPNMIELLCGALEVSPNYLLGHSDAAPKQNNTVPGYVTMDDIDFALLDGLRELDEDDKEDILKDVNRRMENKRYRELLEEKRKAE